ncbi:MAG: homoserine kinase [Candidatus Bathyarchaeia archaeon]
MAAATQDRGEHHSAIRVEVPSTTANLGPGFDVFGMALGAFWDAVELEECEKRSLELEISGRYGKLVPRKHDANSACLAVKHFLEKFGIERGIRIRLEKNIPVGKGLGSSGASAAGAIVGLDRLLGLGLPKDELVALAAFGELCSAGSPHADNVAPAILGGFVVIQSYDPLRAIGMDPPPNLELAIAMPDIEINTKEARAILPAQVPLGEVARNIGMASSIVAGILKGDVSLIGSGMVDAIVEPIRAKLIPGYDIVKKRAYEAGACGVAISGSGPTMLAVVDNKVAKAAEVAKAMAEGFSEAGLKCESIVARPCGGAKVVWMR